MNPFTATLPLPSANLSPNGRLHWGTKASAVKTARKESWYWFRRFLPVDWIRVPVRIDVVYHCPKNSHGYRPRDIENAIAAMKPMIDGMVDAGVIPDDNATWLEWGKFTLTRQKDGTVPGVRISVVPR
jgi:crossover junction endodeoxyribonuclease RusA